MYNDEPAQDLGDTIGRLEGGPTRIPEDDVQAWRTGGPSGPSGPSGPDVEAALADWAGVVNLENRLVPGGIDSRVLAELRKAAE